MADASDSKSDAGNSVWVQVPSPALDNYTESLENCNLKAFFVHAFFVCCYSASVSIIPILPVILRHIQKLPLPADIIRICKLRIFSFKHRAESAHIAVCNALKSILDILSPLLLGGFFYLWRSHRITYFTIPELLLYSSLISRSSFSPLMYGS